MTQKSRVAFEQRMQIFRKLVLGRHRAIVDQNGDRSFVQPERFCNLHPDKIIRQANSGGLLRSRGSDPVRSNEHQTNIGFGQFGLQPFRKGLASVDRFHIKEH